MGHGRAGLLLHIGMSGSGAAGADLEKAQTSTEHQGREGGKDLPDLPEEMAGGMRPEEL